MMNDNQKEAIAKMRGMIYGNWQTCVTYAFAELAIADILYNKPTTLDSLAAATKVEPKLLLRFLKCCEQLRFITYHKDTDLVILTPFGAFLRSDHPYSQRDAARLNGAPYRYDPWGRLVETLLSGDGGAFSPTHQTGSLAYLQDKPGLLEVFQRAMTNLSVTENEDISGAYDFSPFTHVIDIGGGHGTFIKAVLKNNPHLAGTIFDLKETLATVDVKDNGFDKITLEAGDFFESIPHNGDIYIMKNVLHNWPEQKVIEILNNARKALTTAGSKMPKRLLIIEYIVPEENTDSIVTWMDLNFFILVGGSDRTLKEYATLFADCGFTIERLISTPSGRHIIELAASN